MPYGNITVMDLQLYSYVLYKLKRCSKKKMLLTMLKGQIKGLRLIIFVFYAFFY